MTFFENVDKIKKNFSSCETPEDRYQMIIDYGHHVKKISEEKKNEKTKVEGCQSTTYLYATYKDGKLFFEADSDALISLGLAAVLIAAYDGESPETILKEEPTYLKELGIETSISPNRANGLFEMFNHIRRYALAFLTKKSID